MYQPDRWVVIKLPDNAGYKVLGSWYSGFLHGDSWQLNSGIVKVEVLKNTIEFYGYSGSVYECHKNNYGCNLEASAIVNKLLELGAEVMPEGTDWSTLV